MQHLPQGCAATLVKEQHNVKIRKCFENRGKIVQRQGHVGQHGAARLLGGLGGNAVVALVFDILFFWRGYAIPAEKRHDLGHAQLDAVADDLLQLARLGVARKQCHGAVRLGLARRAVGDGKLHPPRLDGRDRAEVFQPVRPAEHDLLTDSGAHDVGQMVGVAAGQRGAAIGQLPRKITMRHRSSLFLFADDADPAALLLDLDRLETCGLQPG